MAFFKVKVGDKTYTLDKLTLGDSRILKRDFGLLDLENFSPTDPDQMVGLLALAISKTDGVSMLEATQQAENLDLELFAPQDPAESDEDPTSPLNGGEGDSEATGDQSDGGKSGKPRKKPGTQH